MTTSATAPALDTLLAVADDGPDAPSPDMLDVRALSGDMTVIEDASMLYRVESEQTDGEINEYTVEPEYQACTCPDMHFRGSECKHIRLVRLYRAAHHADDADLDLATKREGFRQTVRKLSELQDKQPPESDKRAFLSAAQDRIVRALGELQKLAGGGDA